LKEQNGAKKEKRGEKTKDADESAAQEWLDTTRCCPSTACSPTVKSGLFRRPPPSGAAGMGALIFVVAIIIALCCARKLRSRALVCSCFEDFSGIGAVAETFAFNADIQQLMSLTLNTYFPNKTGLTIDDMAAQGSMEIWQQVVPVSAVVTLGILSWLFSGLQPQSAEDEEPAKVTSKKRPDRCEPDFKKKGNHDDDDGEEEDEEVVVSPCAFTPAAKEAVVEESKPGPVAEKAVTEVDPLPPVRTQYIVVQSIATKWMCRCCDCSEGDVLADATERALLPSSSIFDAPPTRLEIDGDEKAADMQSSSTSDEGLPDTKNRRDARYRKVDEEILARMQKVDESFDYLVNELAIAHCVGTEATSSSSVAAPPPCLTEPKIPPSAYFIFVREKRESVARELAGNTSDTAFRLNEMWKNIAPAEKKNYEDRAMALGLEYKEQMQAWKLMRTGT